MTPTQTAPAIPSEDGTAARPVRSSVDVRADIVRIDDELARRHEAVAVAEALLVAARRELADVDARATKGESVTTRTRPKASSSPMRGDSIYQQIMVGLGTAMVGAGMGIAIVDALSTWAVVITGLGLALTIATIARAIRS